ncbi:uncharacterized protein LOC126267920 [Schistocerca gregaria]|uniref:uncharacterized protein LOC126267920 n=1 Tax=Schistocerca gregaria TaxID=7010 RepID=UPI00211ED4EB|nr:uncharacterized protein LOC126267920 [Schistocerca gregaria]
MTQHLHYMVEIEKGVGYIWPTISFRSEKPVSLRTVITFQDEFEIRTHLWVVATADNCILTTHAFLKGHCINPDFIESVSQKDNPIKKPCGMLSPANQTMDEAAEQQKNALATETGCFCTKATICHDSTDVIYYISEDNAVPFPEDFTALKTPHYQLKMSQICNETIIPLAML